MGDRTVAARPQGRGGPAGISGLQVTAGRQLPHLAASAGAACGLAAPARHMLRNQPSSGRAGNGSVRGSPKNPEKPRIFLETIL